MTEQTKIRGVRGEVKTVSGKNTVSVEVVDTLMHPMYRKIIKRSRCRSVHDPLSQCKVGDQVYIQSCRPISKTKKWTVVAIASRMAD